MDTVTERKNANPLIKSPGNGLMEYALPVALVCILTTSTLVLLDLPNALQNMITETNHGQLQSSKLYIRTHGEVDPATLPNNMLPAYYSKNGTTYSFGNQLCLQGNYCMTIPDIPSGSVAEIDGGLGGRVISQYTSVLDQLATQMELAGYSSGLVSRVRTMANTGHDIANTMFQLGTSIEPSYNSNDASPLLTDPNNPRVQMSTKIQSLTQQMNSLRQDMNTYLGQHPELLTVMPEFPGMMNTAASNITTVSSGLQVHLTLNGNILPNTPDRGPDFDGAAYRNDGQTVHMNANTICHSGGGGKACIQ